MNVGIIIVFHNNEKHFKTKDIFKLKVKYSNIDLCLVNNGSTDNTIQILKEIKESFQSRIEIIDIKKTTTKTMAIRAGGRYFRNQGKVKYLGFIDFEEITSDECLHSLLKDIELNPPSMVNYCKSVLKSAKPSVLMNLISLIDYSKKTNRNIDFC